MNDPLNVKVPMRGVNTQIPLLPEKEIRLQVAESTIDPNNANTGLNWNIRFGTTTPETAVDNRDVPPGHAIFHTCSLPSETDDAKTFTFKQRFLGELMDAIDGTNEDTRGDFDHAYAAACPGKFIRATPVVDTYNGRQNNKLKNLKKDA